MEYWNLRSNFNQVTNFFYHQYPKTSNMIARYAIHNIFFNLYIPVNIDPLKIEYLCVYCKNKYKRVEHIYRRRINKQFIVVPKLLLDLLSLLLCHITLFPNSNLKFEILNLHILNSLGLLIHIITKWKMFGIIIT